MRSVYLKDQNAFIRAFETPSDGPAVVYLPAISFSVAASFFSVVTHPKLPAHRAILLDYLGSGASDTPHDYGYTLADHVTTIAALLDDARCRAATLVGHSMGGTVAIELARARPDLVANLIVCEGNVTPGGGSLVKSILAHTETEFVETAFPRLQAEMATAAIKGDPAGLRRTAVWKHISPVGLYRNARALASVRDDLLTDFLNLPIRKTFVYGQATLPATAADAGPDTPPPDLLTSLGVGVAVVPDAGHNQMFENLGGFVKVLTKAAF